MTKIRKILFGCMVASIATLSVSCVYADNVYDQGINSSIRDAGRQSLSQDALRSHHASHAQPAASQQIPAAIVGNYACESMKGRQCDTRTELRLMSNGSWGWGSSSGQYQVAGGAVKFVNGSGGPAGWGDAAIDANTLTFGGNVVWRKRSQ